MSKSTCVVLIAAVLSAALATAMAAPAKKPPSAKAEEVKKVTEAMPAEPSAAPKAKRKILVFYRCEGYRHRSIPIGNKAFEIMGAKTGAFEVVVSNDMSMFTAENLKDFDAVLLNNTTRLKFDDPERRKALLDFVEGGKGLIGIHAACDNFYKWPEGAAMIGGLFSGHPWGAGGTWAIISNPSTNSDMIRNTRHGSWAKNSSRIGHSFQSVEGFSHRLMPPSTAYWSMAANSSAVKAR